MKCDLCGYEIPEDEEVLLVDNAGTAGHYHEECADVMQEPE